ncbi:unnamed protein product, partial [Symbiodinium natans]
TEKAEDDDPGVKDCKAESGDESAEEIGEDTPEGDCNLLVEFCHKLKLKFMEHDRHLKVKQTMISFANDTVYGSRQGFHEALLIVPANKGNAFLTSKFWKTGVIADVSMLARPDFVKLDTRVKKDEAFGAGSVRLTRVQEMKQDTATILLDFSGSDAWPASQILRRLTKSPWLATESFQAGDKYAVATVCHSAMEEKHCKTSLGHYAFSLARQGKLKLTGFPDFDKATGQLRETATAATVPSYAVTVAVGRSLVVKEALKQHWLAQSDFAGQARDLFEAFDKEFNPENLKRGGQTSSEESAAKKPRLNLDLEKAGSVEELPGEDATALKCGAFTLTWTTDEGKMFIHADEQCTVKAGTELFGFGNGEFATDTTATDVMSDQMGKWIAFDLAGTDVFLVLEPDTKLPDHLKDLPVLGKAARLNIISLCADFFRLPCSKVTDLQAILRALEDAGEVEVNVAGHSKDDGFVLKPTSKVVFVLEDKAKKSKKKKKGPNAVSWGSLLTMPKIRGQRNIAIGWRLSMEEGSSERVLCPVRPIAVLSGDVTLQSGKAMLLM